MSNIEWYHLLIHLLCAPLYQIIGTARHESSHALVGWVSHLDILEIRILPSRHNGRFLWGLVRFDPKTLAGNMNVHVYLAPYYVDAVWLAPGVALYVTGLAEQIASPHLALFAGIMLVVSPVVDTVYNLGKWALKGLGDFAKAREFLNARK